ncbi:MAG: MBL fold metallo-hydrolase [Pseudomonadota bacterium]
MSFSLTRRGLLHAALGGAAFLGLRSTSGFAKTGSFTIRSAPLAEGLTLFEGAGGNVVTLSGPDGVLMVDGGLAEASRQLQRAVADQTGGSPVRLLFNTHWHWDHTGSNESLAAAGAKILAHENTRLWLGTEIISKWENRTYPRRPEQALPTETFHYDSKRIDFGGRQIEYGYLMQAHTDGDIYVHFPDQNVIVAGDVVATGSYPILDYSTGGWLGGMIDALKVLIDKCDGETRIVPGKGPPVTRAALEAQREMCLTVYERIGESYYRGETWEELVASRPTREFDETWGDPAVFLHTAYEGAWGHITELRRPRR